MKAVVNLAFVDDNTNPDIINAIQAAIDNSLVETVDGSRSLGGLKLVNDGAPIVVRQIPGKFQHCILLDILQIIILFWPCGTTFVMHTLPEQIYQVARTNIRATCNLSLLFEQ